MLWPLLLLFILPYSAAFQTCSQPPCPCFPTAGRPEIRHLSSKDRAKVAAAFRNARELVPKRAWSQIGKTLCLLVNSLDAALRPSRFPFWDSRIEQRMANPKDSFIFLGKFFPDKSMRRRRRSRDRRGRPELPLSPSLSPQIFSALRNGRHAQLLLFMHSVGLQMRPFVNDTCDDLCPGKQQYLSCSQGKCFSKLRTGALCYEDSPPDCYDSVCVNNICSVPSVKKQPVAMETYKVIQDDGLTIVQLADDVDKSSNTIIEGSGSEAELGKNFYEIETSTQSVPKSFGINGRRIMDFNTSLSFPTVYIPISITRKRQIHHYADDLHRFVVYSQGANFPSGYTQQLAGVMSNSSRAFVRVLDPQQAVAVEVNIIVEFNGNRCVPTCLGKKNTYKRCNARLRLSKYKKITDPVDWYKQPLDIPTTWIGVGYYRKLISDYLLFNCA